MDEQDARRVVYESTLLDDVHKILCSSRFTALCHYNRVESMRKWEDCCKLVALTSGVSGIIVPAIQNFQTARILAPLVFGVSFYCADRLGKYFGEEKERSFRGASKWMKLYTTATAAKSTILAKYISAELSINDLEGMRQQLYDMKISLDSDPDSPTYGFDYAVVNKLFDNEEAQLLESSMESLARLKKLVNSKVPPTENANKALAKLLGDCEKVKKRK